MSIPAKNGKARSGKPTRHWWMQRLTALALVPLTVWFVVSIIALSGADYPTMVAWVSNPFVSILLLLMLVSLFYHLRLGAQEILEDYIYTPGAKTLISVALTFGCYLLAAGSIVSVLKIFVGG